MPQLPSLVKVNKMFVCWDWRRPGGETKHEGLFPGGDEIVDPRPGENGIATHRWTKTVPLCDIISYVLTDGRRIVTDDQTLKGSGRETRSVSVEHTHGGRSTAGVCYLSKSRYRTVSPLCIFEAHRKVRLGSIIVGLAATAVTVIMTDGSPQGGHNIQLAFSPTSVKETGTFRLLELPPDLLKLVESGSGSPLTWNIKGNPAEDAVLCTDDKTYAMRSVSLSNSVLVVGPGETQDEIVIRDTNRELLQVTPIVPKVHKLVGLLRGREYDEGREDLDDGLPDGERDNKGQQQVRPRV